MAQGQRTYRRLSKWTLLSHSPEADSRNRSDSSIVRIPWYTLMLPPAETAWDFLFFIWSHPGKGVEVSVSAG